MLPVNRVCSTRIWSLVSPLLLAGLYSTVCYLLNCGCALLHCDMSPLVVARHCSTKGVGTISPSSLPTAVYFTFWYLLVLVGTFLRLIFTNCSYCTTLPFWNQFESSTIFNYSYLSILVLTDPQLELSNRTYFSTLPTTVKLFHYLTSLLLFAQFNWNQFEYSTFVDQSWP